ncbi:response regulator [Curvibacter sp. CHRR-16]|uniref:response regulator n=1 Tax=Curvibacter sp. CHRR-16 TaxID=2835872 RepID=UPI001BDA64B7|nr:response regulator [Curvibacter sp. CHRR-16]MBT0568990.1 response regulator [Curvibacter sp. CHRR-16]
MNADTHHHHHLADCKALVVDSNPTTRSILVAQLRDFGLAEVSQANRPTDARKQLEYRRFDFVLCEHHFNQESMSGQDLLDDLRRNQLLPFSTVFFMITAEASYSKVAEAAESALDGYLLKPHKASQLAQRLSVARQRKVALRDIFDAIEAENFELAAQLCMERFETRGKFWLYAARIGAELLLRIGKPDEAQELYRAVVEARTVPWARLGIARAEVESGNHKQAISALQQLIRDDSSYTDAYDVMARAQFELGQFEDALATYKIAADLTPNSVSRIQNLAQLSYYRMSPAEVEPLLDKTVRSGLESKMFDPQTLVLLGFCRLQLGDAKGLRICREDLDRLLERDPESIRLERMQLSLQALEKIQTNEFPRAIELVETLGRQLRDPDFDFEAASNLVGLMAHLAHRTIELESMHSQVEELGMRFCTTRALSDLLAACAKSYPPYVEKIEKCQAQVLEYAEVAVSLSMHGNPTAAVNNLLIHGRRTLNTRLLDNAFQLLNKHKQKVENYSAQLDAVERLRKELEPPRFERRQAGGLAMRIYRRSAAKK